MGADIRAKGAGLMRATVCMKGNGVITQSVVCGGDSTLGGGRHLETGDTKRGELKKETRR